MAKVDFLTIPALGRLLRSRRISAVELAERSLDRLERLGPAYNAVVRGAPRARPGGGARSGCGAGAGKDRGPLHGIPYGVKDLLAVEGAPTTWGASGYRNRLHQGDATVVRRLRRVPAPCSAPSWRWSSWPAAWGTARRSPTLLRTRPRRRGIRRAGPADPRAGRGPRSAAGLVPFAIGSETWGSIQYPAAFCGVTGLRPSFGRVSRHGAMALSPTMDKLGPLARTAEDCGLVLAAIAGPDPEDPSASGRRFVPPGARPVRRYRLGDSARHAGPDAARGAPELRGLARRCCGEIAD